MTKGYRGSWRLFRLAERDAKVKARQYVTDGAALVYVVAAETSTYDQLRAHLRQGVPTVRRGQDLYELAAPEEL